MSSHTSAPTGSSSPPALDPSALLAEVQRLGAEIHRLNAFANAQQQRPSSASSSSGAPRIDLPKIASPSKFAGQMGNTVDDWIKEIWQQFNYYGAAKFPDDPTLIRFAIAHLTGAALQWWTSLADASTIVTWIEFQARLHSRFRPVQAAMFARQKLGQLRMRAQHKVSAYVNVFLTVLNPIADMGDSDQVHHFVNGLLPAIAQKVWPFHPKTLKEAIDQAITQEAMLDFGRAAVNGVPYSMSTGGQSGSHVRSSGHTTSAPMEIASIEAEIDSFVMMDAPPSSSAADRGFETLASALASMDQRLNALTSQTGTGASGGQGSFRRAPRIPGLTPEKIKEYRAKELCFKCGQKGHMKNECPKRN
jgi:hypothetical protein